MAFIVNKPLPALGIEEGFKLKSNNDLVCAVQNSLVMQVLFLHCCPLPCLVAAAHLSHTLIDILKLELTLLYLTQEKKLEFN
jgi:hypothetical protein